MVHGMRFIGDYLLAAVLCRADNPDMSNLPNPLDHQDLSHRRLLKTLIGASGSLPPIKRPSKSRLLFRNQLRLWKLAWAEFGRTKGYTWMKRGYGVAALLLFTGAGQSIYTVAHWLWPFLPWYGWILMFAFTTICVQAFIISYSAQALERRRQEDVNELEERLWVALDRLQPDLRIIFDPNFSPHFVQDYDGVKQIRVAGISTLPLSDAELTANEVRLVEVELVGIDEEPEPPFVERVHSKLYLRPMHDRNAQGTRRVKMRANEFEYWDLLSVSENGEVFLNHIESIQGRRLAPGMHEFELVLSGGERPSATQIVSLVVSDDGISEIALCDGRLRDRGQALRSNFGPSRPVRS